MPNNPVQVPDHPDTPNPDNPNNPNNPDHPDYPNKRENPGDKSAKILSITDGGLTVGGKVSDLVSAAKKKARPGMAVIRLVKSPSADLAQLI